MMSRSHPAGRRHALVLGLVALSYGLLLAAPAFGALTPEQSQRKWQDWTRQQILDMGWIPYGDEGNGRLGTSNIDLGKRRWDKNDPNAARLGTCVTYSFRTVDVLGMDIGINVPGFWTAARQAEFVTATGTWAAAADIHFSAEADANLAHDAAGAVNGNIRVGAHSIDGALNELAHAFYPPVNGVTAAGDVHFDTAESWKIGGPYAAGDLDVQTVALHELGHSLGLSHNNTQPGDVMFGAYSGENRVLKAIDIFFIRAIYGVPGHLADCTGVRNPATGADPSPGPIPTPGTSVVGLLLLAQVLLLGGIWTIRRQRRAKNA